MYKNGSGNTKYYGNDGFFSGYRSVLSSRVYDETVLKKKKTDNVSRRCRISPIQ